MKKLLKRSNLFKFVGILPVLFLFSCQKEVAVNQPTGLSSAQTAAKTDDQENTFYGPQVQVGDGKMRSFATLTHDGVPVTIGIEITDSALYRLPMDPLDEADRMYLLPLHQKAKDATVLDHIMVNWNPNGHPPPGVFDIPHFDFHFYQVSVAKQLAVPAYEADPSGFDNLPLAGYIPSPPYIRFPGGEPQMGTHWGDVTSPEFNGQTFTHTFIYGSYNGKVTFYEPMITRAFLLSGQAIDKAIPQPTLFSPGGYYQTHYKIWKEGNKHYVALTDFVWR
jgi:hypothetical protein